MDKNTDTNRTESANFKFNFGQNIMDILRQYFIFLAPFLIIYLIFFRDQYMIHHFFGLKAFPVNEWKWIPLLLLAQIPMLVFSFLFVPQEKLPTTYKRSSLLLYISSHWFCKSSKLSTRSF